MEDKFAWDTLEKEFTVTDHAVKDPELVKMNDACELSELKVRGNRITDRDTLIGECRSLDQGVAHLIDRPVGVTGRVQISGDDDETGFFTVDNLGMQFNGFIYSTRGGQVEFDYQLYAAVDEDGRVFDLQSIKEDQRYGIVEVQARRSEVDFDFDIVHPLQAAAWLDLMDKDLVRQLDTYLLPETEDGIMLETIDDPFSLIPLNSLSSFEVDLGHLATNERTFHKTLQAINLYVDSCLSYDKLMTHIADIEGDCLISSGGNFTPTQLVEKDRLLIINEINLQKQGAEGHRFGLGFKGILVGKEAHEPPLGIITQFKSTHNIRSPLRQG